jgi:hypothetical protein
LLGEVSALVECARSFEVARLAQFDGKAQALTVEYRRNLAGARGFGNDGAGAVAVVVMRLWKTAFVFGG